jgi:hypothetical protein
MKNNNDQKQEKRIRQIIIETDGTTIQIKKIEVAGVLEAKAIFDSVIGYLNQLPEISQKEKNSV